MLAALPAPPRSAAAPHTEAEQPPSGSCTVRRAARRAEVARGAQLVIKGLHDALRRVLPAALPYRGTFGPVAELRNCLPVSAPAAHARQVHLCDDLRTREHEGAGFGQPGTSAGLAPLEAPTS